MSIVVFEAGQLLAGTTPAPVPVPIGEPVSMVRSASRPGATGRAGAWECSPGVWRRQIVAAEFCFFLEGEARFEPDEGEAVTISAGQAAYFPANSLGTWHILAPSRKVFVLFEEAAA